MARPTPTIFSLRLAILVFTGIILISGNHQAMAKSCSRANLASLAGCQKYVVKSGPEIRPSQACCKAVKTVDVPCVCKLVTRDIEKVIDMRKVVFVARSCGKKVKTGTKCGSYTVPRA